jgi:hypothetical protein
MCLSPESGRAADLSKQLGNHGIATRAAGLRYPSGLDGLARFWRRRGGRAEVPVCELDGADRERDPQHDGKPVGMMTSLVITC